MSTETTERNRATISQAFEAWSSGMAPITNTFVPEMTWRIEGHSAASRDYADMREFIAEVLDPFARRFSTADPFRPVKIRSVHSDGDTVIVIWDGRGTTIAGTTYENSYVWAMRMKDDKVVDGLAFYDSISFNDLWAHVAPVS